MPVKSIRFATLAAFVLLSCTSGSEPDSELEGIGTVDVYLAVTGIITDTTSHSVVVQAGSTDLSSSRVPYQGGTTRISGIPSGSHSVRVETAEATCWVTSRNPQDLAVVAGETAQASFALSCFGPPARVYNRVDQEPRAYSDRFIVEPDGTFRLQFLTPGQPLGEARGSWSRSGFEYLLSFSLDEWATGLVHGDCLSIQFSPRLSLSDFEDGEFCAAHGPAGSYGEWTTLAPLPEARVQAGVTSLNGIVYVAGGASGSRWRDEILAYDPAEDQWRQVGTLPNTVRAPAMVAVGDRIYIAGGFGNHQWNSSNYLQVFDPATGRVEAGPSMPTARGGAAAVALDGRLHVVGGDLGLDPVGGWPADAHEVFDPSTGLWTTRTPMPVVPWEHVAVALDRKIHVVGNSSHLVHMIYDVDTDTWAASNTGRLPRQGIGAALLGRSLYIIGGSDGSDCCDLIPTGEVTRLDLDAMIWTEVGTMRTVRSGHAVAVADGSIYVVGGWLGTPPWNHTTVNERFTPASP